MIVKAVTRRSHSDEDLNGGETNQFVSQYKEVIRVQGRKVNELTSENEELKEQMRSYAAEIHQLKRQIDELKEQNTELRLRVKDT